MPIVYWIILAAVFVVIELATVSLTTIWFAGGGLAAFLVGLMGLGLPVQIGVFVTVSVLLLAVTRPIAARWLNAKTVKTNADSLIGRCAVITETVDNREAKGQAQVEGHYWTARSLDGSVLKAGSNVVIREIQGVKLIVERVPEAAGDSENSLAEH